MPMSLVVIARRRGRPADAEAGLPGGGLPEGGLPEGGLPEWP